MNKILLFICVFSLWTTTNVCAQTSKFKALFIYNFSLNVDWPGNASSDKVVVTVLGDDEIQQELESISKMKKVGSKSLVVKSVDSVKEIEDSQIIFVGSSKSSLMPILDSYQKNKEVLIVADKAGLCKQGSGICFTTVSGKLRFEISQSMIEAHSIKISQKIVSLGIPVQ